MTYSNTHSKKESWLYLFNLVFYFIPMFSVDYSALDYLAMTAALVAFLYCYFVAFNTTRTQLFKPILAIILIAFAITPINPGSIAMFAHAGFFIGYANPLKKYLLHITSLLLLLVLSVFLFEQIHHQFLYFALPLVLAISFLGLAEQQKVLKQLAEQQSADEIKQLATLVERERIGRDLHDILGHTLSCIILKADLAEKLLARDHTDAARQQLTELSQISRDALSQVRQSVSGYRHQGLTAEVVKLLKSLRDASFKAELIGHIPRLGARQETTLVLVLTELSTNVIRHSKGDYCQLEFEQHGNMLHIVFSDNGPCSAIHEGNGMQGMRERIAAIGGSLTVNTSNGFSATIQLPL